MMMKFVGVGIADIEMVAYDSRTDSNGGTINRRVIVYRKP